MLQSAFEDEMSVSASYDLGFTAPKSRVISNLQRGNVVMSGVLIHQERANVYTQCDDMFSKLNLYCSKGKQVRFGTCYLNQNMVSLLHHQTCKLKYLRVFIELKRSEVVPVVAL